VGGSGEFAPELPHGNHRTEPIAPGRRSGALDHERCGTRAESARRTEQPWNDSSTSPEGEVLLIESVKLWWVTVRPRAIRTAESCHS